MRKPIALAEGEPSQDISPKSLYSLIADMEADLGRVADLLRAQYDLIGEAVDESDPGHAGKLCVCSVAIETQGRVLEQ
jgi:hypothetical protein